MQPIKDSLHKARKIVIVLSLLLTALIALALWILRTPRHAILGAGICIICLLLSFRFVLALVKRHGYFTLLSSLYDRLRPDVFLDQVGPVLDQTRLSEEQTFILELATCDAYASAGETDIAIERLEKIKLPEKGNAHAQLELTTHLLKYRMLAGDKEGSTFLIDRMQHMMHLHSNAKAITSITFADCLYRAKIHLALISSQPLPPASSQFLLDLETKNLHRMEKEYTIFLLALVHEQEGCPEKQMSCFEQIMDSESTTLIHSRATRQLQNLKGHEEQ
ncbi:MAG: hypothetical protein LKE40_01410 [Spirochaetia bacterium]|jgi:hypothetical protein|nr:hypothetical protein [Spirochaetia bacterium]